MRLPPSPASAVCALCATVALAAFLAGFGGAPRAAHAAPGEDPAERGDPFWPADAGAPDAGARPLREVVPGYPGSCACRAAQSPVSPAGDGCRLVASAAFLAALRRHRRAPSRTRRTHTLCAMRRLD